MAKTTQHAQDQLIKIVLFGPESTGKTTLAQSLANHYQTNWVEEFARDYLQKKYDDSGLICEPKDIMPIVEGQLKLEKKKALNAKKFLFCDTNPLQTYVYANAYYTNYENKRFETILNQLDYQLYFLTNIDTPWVKDDLRDKPTERHKMLKLFSDELKARNLKFTLLSGNENQRLQQAITYIDKLF